MTGAAAKTERTGLKRRVVGAAVVAFALWPAVQYGLTQSHFLNPWRLYGWAMYSSPNLPASVLLVESRDGRAVRIDAAQVSDGVLADARRLERRYGALGRFVDPEPFARTVLDEHPDMEGVMVVFMRRFLSRESSEIEVHHDKFVLWRNPGPRPASWLAD